MRTYFNRPGIVLVPLFVGLLASCAEQPTETELLESNPVQMDVIAGNGQTGLVGEQLPSPLVVRVTDANGAPVPGQIVNFRVTGGGGSVFAGAALTDADGRAQDWWTLGSEVGENRLEARAVDSATGERHVFASFVANGVTELPTPTDTVPPGSPGQPAVAISEVTTDSFTVRLSWSAGTDATSYEWSTGTESGTSWSTDGTVTSESVSFEAPLLESTYWTCIRSVDAAGNRGAEARCNRYTSPASSGTSSSTGSITVSPGSSTLQVGSTVQLDATARDANGVELSNQTFAWTSLNTNVATVDAGGRVTARTVGTALITVAAACCSVDTATILVAQPVSAPAPAGGVHGHQPSGASVILNRGFDAEDELGWSDGSGTTTRDAEPQVFSIGSDPTAPFSPNGVGIVQFPAGHSGDGSSSATAGSRNSFATFNRAGQQIYLEFWFKIDEGWYGHTGGQNKVFYLGNSVVVEFGYASGLGGTRDQPMYWTVALQGGETINLRHNLASNEVKPTNEQAQMPRGRWVHAELLVTLNTPGVSNGSVRFWRDGVEVMRFSGNRRIIGSSGMYSYIDHLQWHPIYGGQDGADVPDAQYQYMDHVYVSGVR